MSVEPARDVMNMSLGGFLGRDQIIPGLRATNRWEAIDELIANLITTGKLKPEHREAVTAAVRKRESSMSTGIGRGIGLPHAATDATGEVIGAFGRSEPGLNFDALDGQPVHLVVLFLVPQGQVQKHLHAMADIARLLHKEDFRRALDQAPDADAILQIIRSRQIP
jgi:PTS system fructose-specific IIC component